MHDARRRSSTAALVYEAAARSLKTSRMDTNKVLKRSVTNASILQCIHHFCEHSHIQFTDKFGHWFLQLQSPASVLQFILVDYTIGKLVNTTSGTTSTHTCTSTDYGWEEWCTKQKPTVQVKLLPCIRGSE